MPQITVKRPTLLYEIHTGGMHNLTDTHYYYASLILSISDCYLQ
jgi:hypothetical protein